MFDLMGIPQTSHEDGPGPSIKALDIDLLIDLGGGQGNDTVPTLVANVRQHQDLYSLDRELQRYSPYILVIDSNIHAGFRNLQTWLENTQPRSHLPDPRNPDAVSCTHHQSCVPLRRLTASQKKAL